ncbi:hypothetical protein AKG70_18215 [Vibrio parahaemolyticus]|nr:hypothetical protein AKG70_18215 [Vibrio parahaemolyticus]
MQIDGHHTLTYVIARYAGGGGPPRRIKSSVSAQLGMGPKNYHPKLFVKGAMYTSVGFDHKLPTYARRGGGGGIKTHKK